MSRRWRVAAAPALSAVVLVSLVTGAPAATDGRVAATSGGPAGRSQHSYSLGGRHRWLSGVFVDDTGFSTYKSTQKFGRWRHSPVQIATDFAPAVNWENLAGEKRIVASWGHQHRIQLSLAVPMWPAHGSLGETASGRDNHWFKRMAQRLVAAGLSHTILRIGWEFNESFAPWHVDSARSAREYARAFRQVVRAVRSVKHQHFRFDWCVYDGLRGYRHLGRAYPGDRYVDVIGADVYDFNQRGRHEGEQQRWRDLVHGPAGLAWQARFARRHDKPLGFAEWALVRTPLLPGLGAGDDPRFVQHMWRWFRRHDVGYEDYFDSVGFTGTIFNIDNVDMFPASAKVYRQLWGSRTAAAS